MTWLKEHKGIILKPSKNSFDEGSSAFICAFVDSEEPKTTYLYYSGAKNTEWNQAGIGLAISNNGLNFKKFTKSNPLIECEKGKFNSRNSITPAVVRLRNHYYMFFAGSKLIPYTRKIGVAFADDPKGPWKILGMVAKPERYWEGWSIDLGPSVVKIDEEEVLVYYSNATNKFPFGMLLDHRYWYLHRFIGILKVKFDSPSSFTVLKHNGNPLRNLNGNKGRPNESLFCPGCFYYKRKYFLLPSMSTYSIGFPFYQYIGLASDITPYFENTETISTLINGPIEKKEIIPNAKSEIALDTPSPIIKGNKMFLYYSVKDRQNDIWKTALSIIDMHSFNKLSVHPKR